MLKLGDCVRYRGRTFVIAGYLPRGQTDNRVLLEHVLSREQVWADPDEVEQLDDEAERPEPRLVPHDRLEQARGRLSVPRRPDCRRISRGRQECGRDRR